MSLILRELIKKVLKYCFLIFLVKEWGFFINDVILSFFTSTATVFASTSTGFIEGNISDPSLIIQKGVYLVEPAFNYVSKYTGLRLVSNLIPVFVALGLALSILVCFVLIGLQILLIYLEFYIQAMFSVFLLPFGVTKHLKYLGEQSLGALITAGIRLLTVSLLIAVIVSMIKDNEPIQYDLFVYAKLLVSSIMMLFLVKVVPTSISNLLGGGAPKL